MTNNGNGNGKTFSWLLGFFGMLLMSIFGIWLTNLSTDMRSFQGGATERAAKITGLETSQVYINQKLDSVEKKLDIVLDRLDRHMQVKQ
jgi:hypothetical protein